MSVLRKSVGILLLGAISTYALPATPPRTESKPNLVDSYLPACMQIIAHLADLMKYEIRPTQKPPASSVTSTTTTVRPTPPHKPGYYAPEMPPGPEAYFSRTDAYEAYLQRFRNPQGIGYFDRYRLPHEKTAPGDGLLEDLFLAGSDYQPGKLPKDLDLFGVTTSDLLHRVNRLDDYDFEDDEDKVVRFSANYDDVRAHFDLLRALKKVPPTRAYVTLLSLYDALNKEAKNQNLQKFSGYTERIIKELVATCTGSSADQLKFVLKSFRPKVDARNAELIKKMDSLLADFEQPDSYINEAMRDLPPLQFLA